MSERRITEAVFFSFALTLACGGASVLYMTDYWQVSLSFGFAALVLAVRADLARRSGLDQS